MKKFFSKLKKVNETALACLVILIGILVVAIFYKPENTEKSSKEEPQVTSSLNTPKGFGCNIMTIDINGGITTIAEGYSDISADGVVDLLKDTDDNDNMKGVLIRIDSPGGTPVGSQIVMDAVKRMQKPAVALIREYGTSGAYLVASAADTIIASPMSDVGSIGVTISYLENVEENTKNGLKFVELVAGRFKNAGNPDKKLTNEERTLFQRDLNILYQKFIELISENRNMPIEKVRQLADGSTLPGILAIKQGLIDQLGDQETAREWFAKQLDEDIDKIEFCDPVQSSDSDK